MALLLGLVKMPDNRAGNWFICLRKTDIEKTIAVTNYYISSYLENPPNTKYLNIRKNR